MIAMMKTIIHKRQGRRSSRNAKRYNIMTIIWSCIATLHTDLGTKSTGNIQCKQYIIEDFTFVEFEQSTERLMLEVSWEVEDCGISATPLPISEGVRWVGSI